MKRTIHSIIIMLFSTVFALYFFYHEKEVQISITGVQIDIVDGNVLGKNLIEINGKASFQFLQLTLFEGEIIIKNDDFLFSNTHKCRIIFYDRIGTMRSYYKGHIAAVSCFGTIITRNLKEIIILPENSDYYIVAPAENFEEGVNLAETISTGTLYETVNWGGG